MTVDPEQLRAAALVMLAAYAAMVLFGFGPSFQARRARAKPVRAHRDIPRAVEAAWGAVQLVIIGALLATLFVPTLLFASPLSLLSLSQPYLVAAGTSVFLVGAAYAGLAARHLGEQFTVAIEVREGDRFVTSGPYARVRHPIYTGIFLMTAGLALALASSVVAAVVAIALYCGSYRARTEEALFANDSIHGPAYRDYLKRTGRFVPAIRRQHAPLPSRANK